jgi:hypothetical protein
MEHPNRLGLACMPLAMLPACNRGSTPRITPPNSIQIPFAANHAPQALISFAPQGKVLTVPVCGGPANITAIASPAVVAQPMKVGSFQRILPRRFGTFGGLVTRKGMQRPGMGGEKPLQASTLFVVPGPVYGQPRSSLRQLPPHPPVLPSTYTPTHPSALKAGTVEDHSPCY